MRHYVLDLETDGLGDPELSPLPRVLLAVVYDGDEYRAWWGDRACIRALQWLLAQGDVACGAHYGGGFDWRIALDWLASREWGEVRWRTVHSSVLAFEGTSPEGHRFRLWDTIRLLPGGLAKIGKSIGVEKPPLEFRHPDVYVRGERRRARSCPRGRLCAACLCRTRAGRAKVLHRCERDCLILWTALAKLRRELGSVGVQRLGLTLGSSVTRSIRESLEEDERPYTPHGDVRGEHDVDAEVEAAFYAGRCEVFCPVAPRGTRVYDRRQAYPAAICAGPLPWRYKGESRRADWRSAGTTECELEVPADCYLPVVPTRGEQGRLYWPTGKLRGAWSTELLAYAQEVGAARVTRVRGQHRWHTSEALSDWMRRLFELREQTSDEFTRYTIKIASNAGGFGKLVEAREKEDYVQRPERVRDGLRLVRVDLDLWARELYYQPAWRNVVTGLAITARAQVELHRLMARVVALGGALHYCDTDSVACSGAELPTGPGLGELDLQATLEWGWFAAPKLYAHLALGGERGRDLQVKGKGLPGLAPQHEELEEVGGWRRAAAAFLRVACGWPHSYDRSTGIREAIGSGGPVGYRRIRCVRVHDATRRGKRRWLPSGVEHPLQAEGSAPWPSSLL